MAAYLRGLRNKDLALALLCVAQFVDVLDINVVIVALPAIQRELSLSDQELQWVVSAYILLFAGFLLLAGRVADLFGRRRMFMVGLGLFAGASLVCGMAGSPEMLLFGRAAQGLGAAITAPAALSIITATFPEGSERNRALGVWTAVAAAGGAAGLVLGGIITDGLGWEWVFLINVPLGVLSVALAPLLLSESRDPTASRQLDLTGAVTITGGLILLVYGFTRAEDSGFGSASVLVTLTLSATCILAFLLVESRTTNPLVPLGVFRSRALVGASLVAGTLTAATTPIGVLATIYLQRILGYSAALAGLSGLPFSLSAIVGAAVGSRLTGRIGARATMVSGLAAIAVSNLLLVGITAERGIVYVLASAALSGLGIGCASVASTATGTSALGGGKQGLASGFLNSSAQIGAALGVAALVTLAAARTDILASVGPTPETIVGGFRWAFCAGTAIAAAGCFAALSVVSRKGATA